jgi:hypothetical protein
MSFYDDTLLIFGATPSVPGGFLILLNGAQTSMSCSHLFIAFGSLLIKFSPASMPVSFVKLHTVFGRDFRRLWRTSIVSNSVSMAMAPGNFLNLLFGNSRRVAYYKCIVINMELN